VGIGCAELSSNIRTFCRPGLTRKNSDLVLELGPLHEPIAEKSKHNVRYVDRLSYQDLLDHYKPQGINLDKIVPLDHVWPPDEDLADHITSERFSY